MTFWCSLPDQKSSCRRSTLASFRRVQQLLLRPTETVGVGFATLPTLSAGEATINGWITCVAYQRKATTVLDCALLVIGVHVHCAIWHFKSAQCTLQSLSSFTHTFTHWWTAATMKALQGPLEVISGATSCLRALGRSNLEPIIFWSSIKSSEPHRAERMQFKQDHDHCAYDRTEQGNI